MSKSRTTEAYLSLPTPNIGIGLRPGNDIDHPHNRLKGNRNQKSKRKMRTRMGMAKED